MAIRPAWSFNGEKGEIIEKEFSFVFNPGFSKTQKQKNIIALHETIGMPTLEVSTKSKSELGIKLSAFNLKLNGYPLECVFQSSKKYETAGPFQDLLYVSPKEAKRDERHKTSGKLVSFEYDGESYPLIPKTAFYNYIYVKAVNESVEKEKFCQIMKYEYFTDIEFVPTKSINCQARAVAIIKAMMLKFGEIPSNVKFDEFIEFCKKINVK